MSVISSSSAGGHRSRPPTKRTHTPCRWRSGNWSRMVSVNSSIRSSTSCAGRPQFSVEKAYTARLRTPSPGAASTVRRSARVPARWPAIGGSPRWRAQRPLPSMMIATDVAESGSDCSTDATRRSRSKRRRRPTETAGIQVFKRIAGRTGAGSERPVRLVATGWAADCDEREPFRAGHGTARGAGIEPDECPGPHRHLLAVDQPVAVAGEHERDLLLAGGRLVVLQATRAGRQIEAVDAECLDTEAAAHEPHHAPRAGRVDLVAVNHAVGQRSLRGRCVGPQYRHPRGRLGRLSGGYPFGYHLTRLRGDDGTPFADPAEQERVWGRPWGAADEVGRLRMALVRRPRGEFAAVRADCWDEDCGALVDPDGLWYWEDRTAPDLALVDAPALEAERVEVVEVQGDLPTHITTPIYTRDPLITVPGGAIVGRLEPYKRRGEEALVRRTLAALGIPILATVHGSGLMEAARFVKLTPAVAAFATSFRCND